MSAKLKLLTRKEILAVYNAGPEAVIELVEILQGVHKSLDERVKALEDKTAKDSHNSSRPPSSDGFMKPKPRSLRKKGKRRVGGQKGHKGHTLQMVENPDNVIIHPVESCRECGYSLETLESCDYERHQVFDIPPIKLQVTEHRAEIKECPHCSQRNKADFPGEAANIIQYGSRLKSLAVYLSNYQLLPYERIRELFKDIFGISLSAGTLVNINQSCYSVLEGVEQSIKDHLLKALVVNADETGLYVNGERHWLHVLSAPELTFYIPHPKRGKEAMDAMGILPSFNGTLVHDFWKPYLKYDCNHALCNAHHLRDLTFIHEQFNQPWAQDMISLLTEINKEVEKFRPDGNHLDHDTIARFEQAYEQILSKGFRANPPPPDDQKQTRRRGRKKKSKSLNLLERFRNYRNEVLAFMYDFQIPFDNNLAERDIRMMKVQQKISGTFRGDNGAEIFCRIRSYISTVRKQQLNVLNAIQTALSGNAHHLLNFN